jgi:hypothetical protein
MTKKSLPAMPTAASPDVPPGSLITRVADYLAAQDWAFTEVRADRTLSLWLRLHSGCVRVFVDTWEDGGWARLTVCTTLPTLVPAPRRLAVVDAINRINHVQQLGHLELDMADGEVRARTVLEGDSPITVAMIDRVIRQNPELVDQYQAPLLAIAYGNAVPQDVLGLAGCTDPSCLQ